MTRILKKILSGGPFSAVRPYLGDSDKKAGDTETVEPPKDGFERSVGEPQDPQSSTPPKSEDLREGAKRGGTQAALGAFPQVVHLLVNPEEDWGENLSQEVGLPLISLSDGKVDGLGAELKKPEYAKGFILEGFPSDTESAAKLDSLLENVAQDDHRVLGWELTNERHQEVLDHYMDLDLLWMVPECCDPADAKEAKTNLMSCLQGLPALQ